MIKHEGSNSKSRSSKSNSAPSSPVSTSRSSTKNTNNKSSINNTSKLRSSISSSANSNSKNNQDADGAKKQVKKKLAFSDDEILNDQKPSSSKNRSNVMSDNETDYEYANVDTLNNSYNQRSNHQSRSSSTSKDKHKRSSSLTKTLTCKQRERDQSFNNLSARGKNGSTNLIYDYKSIYDAFEKPIDDMAKLTSNYAKTNLSINNNSTNSSLKNNYAMQSSNMNGFGSSQNININNNYKTAGSMTLNDSPSDKYDSNQVYFQTQPIDNYLSRDKIAAANNAAASVLKNFGPL
jgi:hypothetical protein